MDYSVLLSGRIRLCCLLPIALVMLCNQSNLNAQLLDTPADRVSQTIEQSKSKKPCELSARIHLQEGTTKGYLVVKAVLSKDHYIYSLTQQGVSASKIKVTADKRFKLTGKFTPDMPAKVIAKDPWLGHAVEKHFKQVQFFVPIEISSATDLKKLSVKVEFNGQVCGNDSCLPLNEKLTGKFVSYFKAKKTNPKAGIAKADQPTPPSQSTRSANQRQTIRK